MSKEMVNHPEHYNQGNIECIDAMVSAFGKNAVSDFCIINAFKYVWRVKDKNGVQDINKAIWYLNKYKELIMQNNSTQLEKVDDNMLDGTVWVDDKDEPKPSLNEAKLEEVVDYSKTFNCGFSGTSKLVRLPSKGIIKIARRKGDETSINSVCISDIERETFFRDVKNLDNDAYEVRSGQVYFDFWNTFMNKEYARQLNQYKENK